MSNSAVKWVMKVLILSIIKNTGFVTIYKTLGGREHLAVINILCINVVIS